MVNEEYPELTVTTDIWNGTWFINKVLRLSRKYKVPVELSIKLGSEVFDITIKILVSVIAGMVARFLYDLLFKYVRKKIKQERIVRVDKNREAALGEAKGWAMVDAKATEPIEIYEEHHPFHDVWEFYFKDRYETRYYCKIWRNCQHKFQKLD